MKIHYEWVIEAFDEYGDVIATAHAPSYEEVTERLTGATNCEISLVRDEVDRDGALVRRSWANVDAEIDEVFRDADGVEVTPVPRRFHRELRRWQASF